MRVSLAGMQRCLRLSGKDHFDVYRPVGRNSFYKKQPDGTLRHEADLIVDHAIAFLGEQAADQPFAINLWFNACHAEDGDRRPGIGQFPWPQSANGLYDDREMPRPRLDEIFDGLPSFLKTTINRERYFWRWNTDEKYQINMRSYLKMVGIDSAMGRLLKVLEEQGLSDNTIIVYSADNGYHMANRGLAGKWSHYEESLQCLIIMDPRELSAQKGQVIDAMALNLDLLHLSGLRGSHHSGTVSGQVCAPGSMEKIQVIGVVRRSGILPFVAVFGLRRVRTPQFKYVRYVDHGSHEFLHDLRNDPDELINLVMTKPPGDADKPSSPNR